MQRPAALVLLNSATSTTPNVEFADSGRKATTAELVRTGPSGRTLWVIGLPVCLDANVDGMLDRVVREEGSAAVRILTSLDGAFAAFLWDPVERRLTVVNDFAGLQPLYIRRTPGQVALAPRIDGLVEDAVPDAAGWGAFVAAGNFVGERTSVQGITRVPPATVVEYDVATDRLSTTQYWRWPEPSPGLTLDRVDTGELLDLIDANLRAYDTYSERGTLLLSGGFESRLLAALMTRAGRRPPALTLRNPYEHMEIDGRFAARVARELGLDHAVRQPAADFFSSDRYLDYVRGHEVASTSVNLFIAQVSSELQAANVEVSWDGFPFGSIVKEKSGVSFDDFLRKTMKSADGAAWQAARLVFAPDFAASMRESLDAAVRREIDACHPAPHGTQQFFHRNRIRHRIAPNTLKIYAQFLLPFLPGLAKAFYERVVPIPPSVRKGEALYFRIFERHFPKLARLPWCSGGHLMAGTERDLGFRLLSARSAVIEHPRVGNVLRRAGLAPARPLPACVTSAVRLTSLDDPYLNADGIRALQRTSPSGTNADTFARELVFYWTMWRQVMEPSAASASAVA